MRESKSPRKTGTIIIGVLAVLILVAGYWGLKEFTPLSRRTASVKNGWNLILVNHNYYVPDNYEIELTVLANGQKVDARIYPELQDMFDNARADGVHPVVISGFRTQEKQQSLFDQQIAVYRAEDYSAEESRRLAQTSVALPGTSEHQLGLAVDIGADPSKSTIDEVYAWFAQNAHLYGFILRYAQDKTDITGIIYEPWHFRYVGKEAAKEITLQGVCLEEYIDALGGAG